MYSPTVTLHTMLHRFTRSLRRYHSTVSESEVKKFSDIAEEWWDLHGPFEMLHRMNPVRMAYIRSQLPHDNTPYPFEGLNMLDIGCGGGLLTEVHSMWVNH
jgi:2-polyprenyl-3-methyl-5-hydroxy-6-metoxy-1,4-benzoquinol methylase